MIPIAQGTKEIGSKDFSGGLNTISDFFTLAENESPDALNVKFNFDGSVQKRPGYVALTNAAIGPGGGYGLFDFGVASINNLMAAVGTGLFYSPDFGVTWIQILTNKAAQRTYYSRVKDWAIATDDAYDQPYYWTGSAGAVGTTAGWMVQMNSAPSCRYSMEYQGYGLLMNDTVNTLKIAYEDTNTFLSGDWGDYFSIPAERSDQITGGTVLNNKAYVFTKYKIFRVTFVGGNPDFAYVEVKNFGFVPGAWSKVSLKDAGEVIIGLSYDKRIRVFDGSNDTIISDKVEADNKLSDFALSKLSDAQLENSNATSDSAEQVWKLSVCVAPSADITHTLCLNLRNLAFYVHTYSSPMVSMVMTESAGKQYLVGQGSNSRVFQMDTSNTDAGIAIQDKYVSPFIFDESPTKVTKGTKTSFFFAVSSANSVYLEDRTNFNNTWTLREIFTIPSITSSNQVKKTTDLPVTFNAYQYKISSSSGTSDAWKLNRVDGLYISRGYGKG